MARQSESGYHLVSRPMVKRRKTQVPPPPADCSLSQCMRLIGGAWTAHVIWYLREGGRCFTELRHDIAGVSAKMLTSRLRKLEQEGIIERHGKPTSPPTVWYALTPVGRELADALANVVGIAQRLKPSTSTGRVAAADMPAPPPLPRHRQAPSFRASSIRLEMRSRSFCERLAEERSSRAATACSTESSKKVDSRWRSADRLAVSRASVGRYT